MHRIFYTKENAETRNKNISLIVKAIEIIFLQYELEKVGVDSLLPRGWLFRGWLCQKEKYAAGSHFTGSYIQMWFFKNTWDVQDSVWTILKNYNWLWLFIQPHTIWNTPAPSVILHTRIRVSLYHVQFSSVAQSCLTLCNPMDRSTPGLLVHHQLLEFTQTRVHWVSDAIQPSHYLSSPSPPAFNLSQHQGLFKWVSSSHQVAKVLLFQFQHKFFHRTRRTDLL